MADVQETYTFCINRLSLKKPDDPKQFMMTIGYPEKQEQVVSQVLTSQKIQSQLPIKLKINQKSVILKLVELEKAEADLTNQKIRGTCPIQCTEMNKKQQIVIEAESDENSVKQVICEVSYRVSDSKDENLEDSSAQENNGENQENSNNNGERNQGQGNKVENGGEGSGNQEENGENSGQNELNENKGNGKQPNKKNYEELLRQLSEIKNSVEKMIDKTTKEQQNAGGEKDAVDEYFSQGEQSQAIKWYKQKYSKEKPDKSFCPPAISGQQPENTTEPIIQTDDIYSDGQNIQFSELTFVGQIKPKIVQFLKKEDKKPNLKIIYPDEEPATKCKKIFQLPKSNLLFVTVSNLSEVKFNGCLEIKEEGPMPNSLPIFDSQGEVVGVLTFECKMLGIKYVQTIQQLEENSENEESQNEKNKNDTEEDESESDSRKGRRGKGHKNQKENKKSKQKRQKEISKQEKDKKNRNHKSKQKLTRHRFDEDYQEDNDKDKKKNNSPPNAARTRTNKEGDPLDKLDHIRIPGRIRSHKKEDDLTNSRVTSQFEQKQEEKAKNRPQSRRKLQNNAYFQPNRYQTLNDQETPRRNSINNSTSAYFTPNKRMDFLEKSKRNQSAIDNHESTRPKTPSNYVSFKIHSASAKLNTNPDPFIGKFLKFQAKGTQPFITEMISLSKHLNWKVKGCFFEKISVFQELLINIYSEQTEFPKLEGTARIRLALLALDEPSKIHFYRDYIRNSQNKQTGEIIIGYEIIQALSKPRKEKTRQQNPQQQLYKPVSSNHLQTQKLKVNLRKSSVPNNYYTQPAERQFNNESRAKNSSSRLLQKSTKFKNRPIKVIDESAKRSLPKY